MNIEQFVMAYSVEQDRIRAILPVGFDSIRPVLRINAEIKDEKNAYIEFNTAVEKNGKKGWINIVFWDNICFKKDGNKTYFYNDLIELSFERVGICGSCPAEKDNSGCFFIKDEQEKLRTPEEITSSKEFCDCEFSWVGITDGAHGKSIGKTLPAVPEEIKHIYIKEDFTVENAAKIPCIQVLGSYAVNFERKEN